MLEYAETTECLLAALPVQQVLSTTSDPDGFYPTRALRDQPEACLETTAWFRSKTTRFA